MLWSEGVRPASLEKSEVTGQEPPMPVASVRTTRKDNPIMHTARDTPMPKTPRPVDLRSSRLERLGDAVEEVDADSTDWLARLRGDFPKWGFLYDPRVPIGWDCVDSGRALAALLHAHELGVTLYDTADVYGLPSGCSATCSLASPGMRS
jgi:hypothetical protein